VASSIDVTLLQSQETADTLSGPVIVIPPNATEPVSWYTTGAETGVCTLTLDVQVSPDGLNWFDLFTHAVSAPTTTEVNGVPITADATHPAMLMQFARCNISAHSAAATRMVIEHHLSYGLR